MHHWLGLVLELALESHTAEQSGQNVGDLVVWVYGNNAENEVGVDQQWICENKSSAIDKVWIS